MIYLIVIIFYFILNNLSTEFSFEYEYSPYLPLQILWVILKLKWWMSLLIIQQIDANNGDDKSKYLIQYDACQLNFLPRIVKKTCIMMEYFIYGKHNLVPQCRWIHYKRFSWSHDKKIINRNLFLFMIDKLFYCEVIFDIN